MSLEKIAREIRAADLIPRPIFNGGLAESLLCLLLTEPQGPKSSRYPLRSDAPFRPARSPPLLLFFSSEGTEKQSGSASGSSPSFFLSNRPRPPAHPGPPSRHYSRSRFNDEITAFAPPVRKCQYPESAPHFIVPTKAPPDAYMNVSPYFIPELSALLSRQRHRITRCRKMRHPGHTAQASLPPPYCFVAPPLPPLRAYAGMGIAGLVVLARKGSRTGPQVGTTFPGKL